MKPWNQFGSKRVKGELHPKPKMSIFSALSQNYQHVFEKMIWLSWSKMSEKFKNGIEILVGPQWFWVIDSKHEKTVF